MSELNQARKPDGWPRTYLVYQVTVKLLFSTMQLSGVVQSIHYLVTVDDMLFVPLLKHQG